MSNKVALVGVGKIAQDQHVPALAELPDWELVATLSQAGRVEGVDSFDDLDSLFAAHPEVGVVSLCVPPVPRFSYASAALKAGRHVMLEKPPGANLPECHTLSALARDAGVSIYATWHSREAAQVGAAKAWLAEKTVRSLTITWKEDVRRWHPGQEWIWKAGGLGVFDTGINALSIITEILPLPIQLAKAALTFPEDCEMPIAALLEFVYPGADKASADFDWRQEGDQTWTIEIQTDGGTLVLSDGGATLTINGQLQDGVNSGGKPMYGEYERLYTNMAALIDQGESDMDLAPLTLVADAFLHGDRIATEPFIP